jgi:hypothetical protein
MTDLLGSFLLWLALSWILGYPLIKALFWLEEVVCTRSLRRASARLQREMDAQLTARLAARAAGAPQRLAAWKAEYAWRKDYY